MQKSKKLLETDAMEIPLGLYLSIIHRTHFIHLNEKTKSLNLTAGQFPFLMHIFHKEGISQDDLAGHFHLDKGTVARGVKRLEDRGLIYRKVDPDNRRRYLLFLSENGKNLVPQIVNIDNEWQKSVCSEFSDEETYLLLHNLKKLAIKSIEIAHTKETHTKEIAHTTGEK